MTECVACKDSTFLFDSACKPCPSNCATCNSTACLSCPSGQKLNSFGVCVCGSACTECQSYSLGCSSCQIVNGAISTCSACAPGTYLTSPTCTPCPVNCATCSSAVSCQTCQPSFVMINNACVCASSLGMYPNS